MTTKKFRSLGYEVEFSVPSSIEEFDQNAKRSGACLEEGIRNVVYRSTLADFRDQFVDRVHNETGVEFKLEPSGKKDDKGEEIMKWAETEDEYIARAAATKSVDRSSFQVLATEVASVIEFDASATERKAPGPKKLPQMYREPAENIINNGNQEKWAAHFGLTLTSDRAKDIELLGWKIKEIEDAKRKAATAEYQ